jgi:hypothetical protein
MARDEARTDRREEDLRRREDPHAREDLHGREDLHEEGGISPEKISGRTYLEHRPQEGISPDAISGG